MKITDIKRQVKRADRYSIFVDGKFDFSLSDAELLQIGLYVGQEFGEGDLDRLRQTAVLDKAYSRCLDLLARRERTRWELQQYLTRKEYDDEIIKTILNKLSDRGYVDDKRFSTAWVNNRRLLKSTSQRRLRQELQQKRIPTSVIDEVLATDETDEKQVLRDLVAKKRGSTRYQDPLKLMQYLARQGFGYGDIKEILEED